MIQLTVNGEAYQHQGAGKISDLLNELKITMRVVVMVNENIVPAGEFDVCTLADRDCVEILTFAGGG